ncbi:hypothetical protein CBM2586_B10736 [Cupriavidus phytorum]|uniref:Uncharacterized protein n=1 Tax=Cupriavidus taiwanensis TaxID=164546 RepID=A0A976A7F6_9BURK|nr:hypothetical protein CBM2586_B10736 [Cupriavidus taiwanensis]
MARGISEMPELGTDAPLSTLPDLQRLVLIEWPFRPAGPLFDEMGTFDDYPSDMEAKPGQQHLPVDQRHCRVASRSRRFRRRRHPLPEPA